MRLAPPDAIEDFRARTARQRSGHLTSRVSLLPRIHSDLLWSTGYGIDVAAVRTRYPEVPWLDYAEWARTIDLERP